MTRSVLLEAESAEYANEVSQNLDKLDFELDNVVEKTSKFAKLQSINTQIVGNLLYIRFSFSTGEASGHNMVTLASDELSKFIIKKYNKLNYVSVSGNFCVDKKNSAINSILGRGKYTIAELLVPRDVCISDLKTSPEKIVGINTKKNLLGSIIAGSTCSANAHFANMLLAFYLATGQDAANIIEASQGIVHTDLRGRDLYFSVTLPNIIIGSVGNGKDIDFVKKNLEILGCVSGQKNARRLASVAAAAVLCGELSLLAALTNQGELMRGHVKLERKI